MKHLLYFRFVLLVCSLNAQETTVLQINAKWNYKNNYDLSSIKNAVIKFSYLKDQPADIRKNITAVPVIAIIDKNGKIRSISETYKLSDLVKHLKIPMKKVAIELNKEIIDKKNVNKIKLKQNDKIEIVHFIGGG